MCTVGTTYTARTAGNIYIVVTINTAGTTCTADTVYKEGTDTDTAVISGNAGT